MAQWKKTTGERLRELPELQFALWGGLLNGAWEFLHSPLYTDHSRGAWYVIWTRLHCTGGDVMILLASFWITSLLFRSRYWFRKSNVVAPLLCVSVGLAYTVFSEWYNTAVAESWQYTDSMPALFGIGVTPLWQWLIVPPIVILIARRRYRDISLPKL